MRKLLRPLRPLYQRTLTLPGVRRLRFLQLRRLRPLGNGQLGRGTQIVRYYWWRFLDAHQADVRGRALEVGEVGTIRHYGGANLTHAEAIDVAAHSPEVTVVADLSRADHVPSDTYDCFVNQFTMPSIYDVDAALYHAVRILKPGGVLLVNFACVDYYIHRGLDMGTGEPLYIFHQFTPVEVANLFHHIGLTTADYSLDVYGNLLTRVGFLMNLPAEELTKAEIDARDPGQPLLICARVVKPAHWRAEKPVYRDPVWLPEGPPAKISGTSGHYGDNYA